MTAQHEFAMTIAGRAITGTASMDVINPATEGVIAQAPDCSAEELDQAITAARDHQPGWGALPLAERQDRLRRIAEVLTANADDLAGLLTSEQGKPLASARGEILGAASWFARTATMDLPVHIGEDSEIRMAETRYLPLGVVGIIVPWNFPILLASVKLAPALLAGNAVVLKPSPFTPLTTLRVGELLRAILPAGVLNVVSGGDRLGPLLTAHPGIQKISFTGSTATGKKVMANAAERLTRITLELGGNDASIVMPDIDVAKLAETLFASAFSNSGQICIASKRMYVHGSIYDRLAGAFAEIASRKVVGNGATAGTDFGPIQNRVQYERVKALIADSRRAGHKFLCGGDTDWPTRGFFLPLTIVDNPPDDSRVVQEEAFGPLLPLLRFDSVDEVITRANASPFGLGGSVWCADLDEARRIAARLKTGTVWINELQNISPFTVFGGQKDSGFGVENGLHGLLEYTAPQTTLVSKLYP